MKLPAFKLFLRILEQGVYLDCPKSEWRKIKSGVPQGSVIGSLLFLIYINYLPNGTNSMCKIFADDSSFSSKVYDIKISEHVSDLEKITCWAFQWKMEFNSDPNKQANEVIFSRKPSLNNLSYPLIKCNNNDISKCTHQKHYYIQKLLYRSDFRFKTQLQCSCRSKN